MSWQLVIFDNDGVLVDSEGPANAVLAELLSSAGHPHTAEECVDRYLGGTVSRVRQLVERCGGVLPPDFEEVYAARVAGVFTSGLSPVAGVVAALDAIEAPLCVASSGTRARIRLTLGIVGLLDRFEGRTFSAEDVAAGKPAPDLFLHAAATLGADPAECAVIEDSPLGVTAARAAGMTVLGYAGLTPARRLDDAGATAVFFSMDELPARLAEMYRPR